MRCCRRLPGNYCTHGTHSSPFFSVLLLLLQLTLSHPFSLSHAVSLFHFLLFGLSRRYGGGPVIARQVIAAGVLLNQYIVELHPVLLRLSECVHASPVCCLRGHTPLCVLSFSVWVSCSPSSFTCSAVGAFTHSCDNPSHIFVFSRQAKLREVSTQRTFVYLFLKGLASQSQSLYIALGFRVCVCAVPSTQLCSFRFE